MVILQWRPDRILSDYLNDIAWAGEAQGRNYYILQVDACLVHRFARLQQDAKDQLAEALVSFPRFKSIKFNELATAAPILDLNQDMRLFSDQVLSRMTTITKVYVFNLDSRAIRSLRFAFPNMQGMTELFIEGGPTDLLAFQEAMSSLEGHSSLTSLGFCVPASLYEAITPSMSRMPRLAKVTLTCPDVPHADRQGFMDLDHEERAETDDTDNNAPPPPPPPPPGLDDANAIAALLQVDASFELIIEKFDFMSQAAQDAFGLGIANTNMRHIRMNMLSFFDMTTAATAWEGSRVQSLSFSMIMIRNRGAATASITASFVSTLARVLPSMPRLEFLSCPYLCSGQQPQEPEYDESISLLARSAGGCLSLKSLSTEVVHYRPSMDEALADCVERTSGLQHIEIKCSRPTRDVYTSPRLLKSVMDNYAVLTLVMISKHNMLPDPFDADFKRTLAAYLRLNRAGRNYLADDASNKRTGSNILGAVTDDLDCVFFHLRENPLVCDSKHYDQDGT